MNRRYDIDWLRVIAIGLLLIYHIAIGFQPWGVMIGFITSDKHWTSLWTPMSMLNIWRIPLLFCVSGMGVYFAMQKRNWKQMIRERSARILIPFIFGMFFIVPVHMFIWRTWSGMEMNYDPGPGHLWFLGNIFTYVLLLSPVFFFLKNHSEGRITRAIKYLFSRPYGLILVTAAFVAETLIVRPAVFELYAFTSHGFFLGLLAFFSGFCFVFSGCEFWQMIQRWRWWVALVAVIFYLLRTFILQAATPQFLLPVESLCWIIAVLAFGNRYLNKPGRILSYLSQAAYPVYILHMIFLYLGSAIILPLHLIAPVRFLLVLIFTLAGCFISFECIRRISILRPLFGLKLTHHRREKGVGHVKGREVLLPTRV